MVGRPVLLTKEHDTSQFECDKAPLTDWLKMHSLQSQSAGHTKTLVISWHNNVVIGYYAYSVVSVEHEYTTPERVKKGLARYGIPVFLIARLAVDINHQGQGLGGRLLCHALKRAAAAAEKAVPIRAIVVDAIDDEAKSFYRGFSFEPWSVDGMRMWLMMKDLLVTLKAARTRRTKSKRLKGVMKT